MLLCVDVFCEYFIFAFFIFLVLCFFCVIVCALTAVNLLCANASMCVLLLFILLLSLS